MTAQNGGAKWLIVIMTNFSHCSLNMDDAGTQATANKDSLREGIRKIRNIQFNYDDCTALFQRGLKIQGPVINALGALWQQTAEESSDGADWCVFSSWLGDIVSLNSPALVGSLEDHVKVVVRIFYVIQISYKAMTTNLDSPTRPPMNQPEHFLLVLDGLFHYAGARHLIGCSVG